MKKILYYLSNIVLGIYLIAYIPLFALVKSNTQYGFQSHLIINEIMTKVSIGVIIASIILKLIFKSKKFELSKLEKIINITIFCIELLLIFVLKSLTSFA